mmetsp:Transcript_22782/g.68284  ORF Transcript_22782/g.68284 Transcript_22782/m.68284 type:complete len:410 (+) Transcript_22782:33-1262(+)
MGTANLGGRGGGGEKCSGCSAARERALRESSRQSSGLGRDERRGLLDLLRRRERRHEAAQRDARHDADRDERRHADGDGVLGLAHLRREALHRDGRLARFLVETPELHDESLGHGAAAGGLAGLGRELAVVAHLVATRFGVLGDVRAGFRRIVLVGPLAFVAHASRGARVLARDAPVLVRLHLALLVRDVVASHFFVAVCHVPEVVVVAAATAVRTVVERVLGATVGGREPILVLLVRTAVVKLVVVYFVVGRLVGREVLGAGAPAAEVVVVRLVGRDVPFLVVGLAHVDAPRFDRQASPGISGGSLFLITVPNILRVPLEALQFDVRARDANALAAAVVSGVEPPIFLFHARTGLVTGAAAALLRRRRAFVRVGLDYSGGAGREREEQEDGLERRHRVVCLARAMLEF